MSVEVDFIAGGVHFGIKVRTGLVTCGVTEVLTGSKLVLTGPGGFGFPTLALAVFEDASAVFLIVGAGLEAAGSFRGLKLEGRISDLAAGSLGG